MTRGIHSVVGTRRSVMIRELVAPTRHSIARVMAASTVDLQL